MARQKRILVIHPDGNLYANPSLMSIVSFLVDDGYAIDYFSPFTTHALPANKLTGVNHILLNANLYQSLFGLIKKILSFSLKLNLGHVCKLSYWDLLIGVDRDGIILSSFLSSIAGIPYALISYEIYFLSEMTKKFKRIEVLACKQLAFAICQGGLRNHYLSQENSIPIPKIISIPVSSRSTAKGNTNRISLRNSLNIVQDKIAIFIGTLSEWTMVDEILQSTTYWPSDWCLVLHSRSGLSTNQFASYRNSPSQNIYFTSDCFDDFPSMLDFIGQADIGLAFYKPTYNAPLLGRNLECIGLSSGKISCYLQAGIPVATNLQDDYGQLLLKYDAGIIVNNPSDIATKLNDLTSQAITSMKNNASRLFTSEIDAELYKTSLVTAVRSAVKR